MSATESPIPHANATCSNCGSVADVDVFCCASCPGIRDTQILARLAPHPDATNWEDPRAMQWRDPASGKDYYAVDEDGDIIVAGGLQQCTDRLIDVVPATLQPKASDRG